MLNLSLNNLNFELNFGITFTLFCSVNILNEFLVSNRFKPCIPINDGLLDDTTCSIEPFKSAFNSLFGIDCISSLINSLM